MAKKRDIHWALLVPIAMTMVVVAIGVFLFAPAVHHVLTTPPGDFITKWWGILP